ncbi:Uncharacterised protein [Legionella israelensis]|nr:hypothetical protein SAMN02746069_00883 [Legionella israelensis DSM 19235]STX58988.1 Uncharacterised protein [Legionella israelensis]
MKVAKTRAKQMVFMCFIVLLMTDTLLQLAATNKFEDDSFFS